MADLIDSDEIIDTNSLEQKLSLNKVIRFSAVTKEGLNELLYCYSYVDLFFLELIMIPMAMYG